MARNPHYLSQLAHIEILTLDLEKSVKFFLDIVGLDETGREGNSVYLRAWGDYFHHTLKLTQSETSGMGHLGWRADSPEALEDCVAYLEKIGAGIGWNDGDMGHGKAYRFKSPDGHIHEVFWDVVWLRETGEKGSIFADRYAKNRRMGVNPRRFDHVTYMVAKGKYIAEKAFWQGMGLKNPDEVRISDDIPPIGGLWTIGNLSHDIAVFTDPNVEPNAGTFNHVAFNFDSREEVLLALDWFTENGFKSVMGAPTRHKADEGFFIYIIDPGSGILFEFYAAARLIFAPDHGPDVHYLKDNPTMRESFQKAAARFDNKPTYVEVPFEGSYLPGYLFAPANVKKPPLMIMFGGLDSLAEELYFGVSQHLNERGIALLAMDGPGQGAALRLNHILTRYDFNVAGTTVLDWALKNLKKQVDTKRIGIGAVSMGGYMAARCAAFEPRFKVCMILGAVWSYYDIWKNRPDNHPLAEIVQHIVGVTNMADARERLKNFTMDGVAEKISMPTYIVHGEDDRQNFVENAYKMREAMTCENVVEIVPKEETGSAHCSIDDFTKTFNMYDWIAKKIKE